MEEPVKTPEQITDAAVMEPYNALEEAGELVAFEPGMVPSKTISELKNWLKTESYSLYNLRAKIIPICVEHKVTHKSFWQYIQGWNKTANR